MSKKIKVELKVENYYDGECETTYPKASVDAPPLHADYDDETKYEDDHEEWVQENIFPLTGTGREEGDAGYFVEVIASSDSGLLAVGDTFEFV